MEKTLTSAIVKSQLPSFIRDDYPTFVTFIEKYYEWLETNNQVSNQIDALRDSFDIDTADSFYINKLKEDLAPYFPSEVVADKRLFLKLVTQLYRSNGTQESVKFLFRALFNENIDIYYPKDDILKASDGKWVLPLSLRVDTDDDNIFNIEKCIVTGSISKSTAVVEKVVRSIDRQLGIEYTELYISNIQRLFETGEDITASYIDDAGLTVTVSGRLIGALSEIKIDPKNRGLYYIGYDPLVSSYDGDPVTLVGGLNPTAGNPVGALAYVGDVTKGGVTDILVVNSGFGFRDPNDYPDSSMVDFDGGFLGVSFGQEAQASIELLDTSVTRTLNLSTISVSTLDDTTATIDDIQAQRINTVSQLHTVDVYPLSYIVVDSSGGGYRYKPNVDVYSFYNEYLNDFSLITGASIYKDQNFITDISQDLTLSVEAGDYVRLFVNNKLENLRKITAVETNKIYFEENFENDISLVTVFKVNKNLITNIGSLGRFKITSGGNDYAVNEIITFTGGSGYGANAKITEVHAGNNGIKTVTMNAHSSNAYIMGGEGYTKDSLPTLNVQTAIGYGAQLSVTEIVGDGESLELSTSSIGAVSTIRVVSYGYDYVSSPVVSLRNADFNMSSVTEGQLFISNTSVYQGASNLTSTFQAMVDSYDQDTGLLRVFNYVGELDKNVVLKSDDDSVTGTVDSAYFYGNGKARATAKFENGLIRHPGIYLNTDGQLSADKRIQDGNKYHNFSYVVQTSTDYNKFKKPLQDIVHPLGTKTFVTKLESIYSNIFAIPSDNTITISTYSDTFNIGFGANSIVSTNTNADLSSTISVGDYVIIPNAQITLTGTISTTTGSNVITGSSTNFLNQVQETEKINVSNIFETVHVLNGNTSLYTQNTIALTTSGASMNLVFDDVKRINYVNANTILVDTNFTYSKKFASANIKQLIL